MQSSLKTYFKVTATYMYARKRKELLTNSRYKGIAHRIIDEW